jgi:hypothetical protein
MLLILRLAFVAIALVAAWLPLPASLVERVYSGGVYPAWQRAVTAASNRVPFALLDILIVLLAARVLVLLARLVRPGRGPWAVGALGSLVRLAALAAVVYLVFLASWGLNYRRPALTLRLDYVAGRATPEAAGALARRVVAGANRLHAAANRGGPSTWEAVAADLRQPFAAVQAQLQGRPVAPARPGRPKRSVLTFYFERAGVDGMTDPFFLEVLVNRQLLPFERSAVLAHEWAHLAGFADEAEANFAGWLIGLQGSPSAQYSAHLAILWDLLAALPPAEREQVSRTLAPGPRSDLAAVAARVAKTSPALRRVGWRVYDQYLKANRVEAGVRSYGAGLQLLLGTRMGPGWRPAPRPPARGGSGDGTT